MEILFQLVTIAIIFVFVMYGLSGARHGFLCSCSNTGSVIVSWFIAGSISPILSANLYDSSFFKFVKYMTEVSDNVSNIELGKTAVSALTADQLSELTDYADIPNLYSKYFLANIHAQAFTDRGIITVSDYLNETLACVSMNIICFLVVYITARLLFMLIISTWNKAHPFLAVKHIDSPLGAGVGIIRAFLVLFTILMIVPIILMLVSGTKIEGMIEDNALLSFFYTNTPLYAFISGV